MLKHWPTGNRTCCLCTRARVCAPGVLTCFVLCDEMNDRRAVGKHTPGQTSLLVNVFAHRRRRRYVVGRRGL